jgi:hypothetical protein
VNTVFPEGVEAAEDFDDLAACWRPRTIPAAEVRSGRGPIDWIPLAGDLVKQEPRQHQYTRHAEQVSNSVFHGTSRSCSSKSAPNYPVAVLIRLSARLGEWDGDRRSYRTSCTRRATAASCAGMPTGGGSLGCCCVRAAPPDPEPFQVGALTQCLAAFASISSCGDNRSLQIRRRLRQT